MTSVANPAGIASLEQSSLLERAITPTDKYNFAKVLATRLFTNGVAYAWTNREQDRAINDELRRTETGKPNEAMPEATPFGRWIHEVLYKPVYAANRAVANGAINVAKALGADAEAAQKFFYQEYDGDKVGLDAKVGRTLSGFFWGALANNTQNSIIKAVELGDAAPWLNKDGTVDAGTATRWVAQEAFRGVLKGAGEDVFASNSLYIGGGLSWINLGKKVESFLHEKLGDAWPDNRKDGKTFFMHSWEWVGKFWAYNVFTDWWRGIYDNVLGGVEKLIGGRKNNPDMDKPGEDDGKSFLQKAVEAPYKVVRSIIRVPLKLLLPMPIATFFGFVIPGYYSAVQGGGNYQNVADGNTRHDNEPPVNPLDGLGKMLGKGIDGFGSSIDSHLDNEALKRFGFDNFGVEAARGYSRYGGYFGLKKYFLDKWAGPEIDKAMNKSIDGFFGAALSLVTFNFKGVARNIEKIKEGAVRYKNLITFREVVEPNTQIAQTGDQGVNGKADSRAMQVDTELLMEAEAAKKVAGKPKGKPAANNAYGALETESSRVGRSSPEIVTA